MLSKVADLLQVAKYGVRCEVAHRHVVDHPLAQWGNLAGGQDGVVNRCGVAHGEQQYRTSRRPTYRYWIWRKKTVVATELPRSGLVQCPIAGSTPSRRPLPKGLDVFRQM